MKKAIPSTGQITEAIWHDRMGWKPSSMELDIANCKKLEARGLHGRCGWCPQHNIPRKECGCYQDGYHTGQ